MQGEAKRRKPRENNDYLRGYDRTKGRDGPHVEIIDKIVIFRGLQNNGRVPNGHGPQMTG